MKPATIAAYFSQDHDRLDALFRRFQTLKATDRPSALAAFQEFQSGLERHIVWEEEILFPKFEQKTGQVGGPTEVMRGEHRQIRGFLEAMAGKLAQGDRETAAEEAGLLAVLGPHNEKEENILYPMIDQVCGAEERTQIFAEMSQRA